MIDIKPIIINNEFSILNSRLLTLLKSLKKDSWYNPTVCEKWCVKDIVQHLVKDYIGVLSRKRDKYTQKNIKEQDFTSKKQLVQHINTLNQEWVNATKQVSPNVLIRMLAFLGKDLFEYFNSVDQTKIDSIVSWIGDHKLPNWMDSAREYTEHWLHQAHIREAVNAPLLTETQLFHPFIRTYMLALPKTYAAIDAKIGTKILVSVLGESGGNWLLEKIHSDWKLTESRANVIQASIKIDQDILWRLFSKGMKKEIAEKKMQFDGDIKLGKVILNTVSLIA